VPTQRRRSPARPQRPRSGPKTTNGAGSDSPTGIRLQKILADAGVASRRAAERLILDGAVSVNGRVVNELGARADPADDIRVSDQPIALPRAHVYMALHKPVGYVTTVKDEFGRATVIDLLPANHARVFPVGRLDRESEGLLLLTNDGDLTERLTHPRFGVEKEYAALVDRDLDRAAAEQLERGVFVEGRRTAPAKIERIDVGDDGAWLGITIHEGRRRQVRLMFDAVGLTVRRLVRVRVGPITIDGLHPGRHRHLTAAEVRALKAAVRL
jgi:23S rRNA pseudouridine2605 synthase